MTTIRAATGASALALGVALVALGSPTSAAAQGRPAPPAAELMAGPGRPGWSVDPRTGCWLWNEDAQPGETVSWSEGCAADGPATGRGVLEWRAGGRVDRYEGTLREGRRDGRGVNTMPGGDRYDGEWKAGRRAGRGLYTMADGGRYDGEWADDKPGGRGRATWPNGDRYDGTWRDGRQDGRGVKVWASGDRYEGEYRGGKEDGQGVYVWADGSRYEGEWREGKITGRGVKTWASGSRYEGEWRDGWPDGVGEAVIGESRYTGTWVAGCFREGGRRVALGRPLARCP